MTNIRGRDEEMAAVFRDEVLRLSDTGACGG